MSNEFLDHVENILDSMEKAETLLNDVSVEQLASDFRVNFAVVRAMEIIGEASKCLPMTLRDKYRSIPWENLAVMSDRLIHPYDDVNYQSVWKAVKQDIPRIRPQIQQILTDYEG